jgi:uncharacterized protein (TIGR00106 family)
VIANNSTPKGAGISKSGYSMKVIMDLCIVPIGVGVSLSGYVAACEKVLKKSGLMYQLHANGTNIEGEWDPVFEAVKECHKRVHQMGALRIFSTIKVSTRIDREQSMAAKMSSVERKLREPGKGTT